MNILRINLRIAVNRTDPDYSTGIVNAVRDALLKHPDNPSFEMQFFPPNYSPAETIIEPDEDLLKEYDDFPDFDENDFEGEDSFDEGEYY